MKKKEDITAETNKSTPKRTKTKSNKTDVSEKKPLNGVLKQGGENKGLEKKKDETTGSKEEKGQETAKEVTSEEKPNAAPVSKWNKLQKEKLHPGQKIMKRSDSLNVPTVAGRRLSTDPTAELSVSNKSLGSRRESTRSTDSRLSSNIDLTKIQNAQVATEEDENEEKSKAVVADDIRSAIPYLPLWLAIVCLMLNIVVPGIGTILSGFSMLCCGKSRISGKDSHVMSGVCLNVCVGVAQLFTVSLMLVGWFWSLTWGIYIVILAVDHRREQMIKHDKQLQAMAVTAFNSDIRPWTLH